MYFSWHPISCFLLSQVCCSQFPKHSNPPAVSDNSHLNSNKREKRKNLCKKNKLIFMPNLKEKEGNEQLDYSKWFLTSLREFYMQSSLSISSPSAATPFSSISYSVLILNLRIMITWDLNHQLIWKKFCVLRNTVNSTFWFCAFLFLFLS